jgi:transcriptional regulator with XRE-family HTH domain
LKNWIIRLILARAHGWFIRTSSRIHAIPCAGADAGIFFQPHFLAIIPGYLEIISFKWREGQHMDNKGDTTAETLRVRFERAFEESEFKSLSQLASAAGLSPPVLHKMMNGHFADSRVGPGIFTLKRVATALDIPVGYLIGDDIVRTPEALSFFNGTDRNKGILEALLETHARAAGRFEAFGRLIDHCDQYEVPTPVSETPIVLAVGKHTLFAGRLGGPFARDAQKELDNMPPDIKQSMIDFHQKVAAEEMAIGTTFLNHAMVTRASRVFAANIRLGLLVRDEKNRKIILLHAMPVPV